MMKGFMLFLLVAVPFCLCSCGGNKVLSKTCTMEQDGIQMTFDISSTNDTIDKIGMKIIPDSETMGIQDFHDLDTDTKEQIQSIMLSTLGLEEDTEGIEVDVQFTDQMVIHLTIDLTKADKKKLSGLGLDLDNTDMSMDKSIQELEDEGATCK